LLRHLVSDSPGEFPQNGTPFLIIHAVDDSSVSSELSARA
jgi:hypothetical protein